MVLDPELQEQARQLFVEEALELLQEVQENLVEFAENPTSVSIEEILENVRLVIDGAMEVELIELQIPVARLESILLSFGKSPKELKSSSLERIQLAYQDIWSALLPFLPTYQAESNIQIPQVNLMTGNHLQSDLIETIVRVDFPALLERLTRILQGSTDTSPIEELKACAELLLNIGEILQLPELQAIAETTITTLQTNPEFAQAIGKSALADCRKVYQVTLDRYSDLSSARVATESTTSQSESQPLPLTVVEEQTLSTVQSWLWLSGFNLFVLPVDSIKEIINYNSEHLVKSDEKFFVSWQQQIEFYRISQLLKYNCFLIDSEAETSIKHQLKSNTLESLQMPIVNLDGREIALDPEVDRFIVKSKVVIKPFGDEIAAPNYLRGCTVLEDGMLVPVIDVKELLRFHLQKSENFVELSDLENEQTLAVPTILAIDDSKTMREILSICLERAGYQVIKAEDGQTAIAKLQQNPQIKAIICDLEMPEIDGFEFLKYRSRNKAIANIPTIVLTTHNSNDYKQHAFQLGATDYLTIPYSETELLTLLKLRIGDRE